MTQSCTVYRYLLGAKLQKGWRDRFENGPFFVGICLEFESRGPKLVYEYGAKRAKQTFYFYCIFAKCFLRWRMKSKRCTRCGTVVPVYEVVGVFF